MSLDSFTSAVEENDKFVFDQYEDFQEQFILVPQVLLSKYRDHLTEMQCEHWLGNDYPRNASNKLFNVVHNLKVSYAY